MTSQNGKFKTIAGITALLGAVAAFITAISGQEGLPGLIKALRGQDTPKPEQTTSIQTQTAKTQSPSDVRGDGNNNSITGSGNSIGSNNVEQNGSKNIGSGSSGNSVDSNNVTQIGNDSIAIGGSGSKIGSIQKSGDGNCNNIQASGKSVTIICNPSSSGGFGDIPGQSGFSFPSNATAAPVKLKASVSGLQRGSNTFTLLLANMTSDQTVDIPTTRLALSDDQGNTYELDTWLANEIGLSKTIPPNGRIKIDYKLAKAIASNAKSVTFTLNNIWAQPTGNQFKKPLPIVQWTTKI